MTTPAAQSQPSDPPYLYSSYVQGLDEINVIVAHLMGMARQEHLDEIAPRLKRDLVGRTRGPIKELQRLRGHWLAGALAEAKPT